MSTAYWHIHHETLLEWTDNIQERIDYVRESKPPSEVEIRLRWMTPVRGVLPEPVVQAEKAYVQASETLVQAEKAYAQAWETLVQAAETLDQAYEARDQASETLGQAEKARVQAWETLVQAREACLPELEALHAREHPGCPWDGHTLFPGPVTE